MGHSHVNLAMDHRQEEGGSMQTAGALPDCYRSLVEDSSFGFFVCDAENGRFLFLNRRACDLLGYSVADTRGVCIWDIIVPEERPLFKERLKDMIRGRPVIPDHRTYTVFRNDLNTFRAELSKKAVIYLQKPAIQGTLKDVTDYEQFQKKLEYVQRLDTIAVMSDGLADRLLNAVAVIRNNLDQAGPLAEAVPELVKHMAQIQGAARLINSLAQRLTLFSRGGAFSPVPIDLNQFINDLMPLFRCTVRPAIKLVDRLTPDLPAVQADPANLQSVLSAVLANAEEAINGKGRIIFSTALETVDPHWAASNPGVEPGQYVVIGVKDNGVGMNEATRRKVCEPYFSTKFHGRGLGMAAVYGVVKRHHGWLSIESQPGKGTWVRIHLPAAA